MPIIKENIIDISTAEFAVAKSGQKIRTGSIGSCVVVTLYDESNRIGAMAHSMLPKRHENTKEIFGDLNDFEKHDLDPKYVDEAIDKLIYELQKFGAQRDRLTAKIVGGAKMFKVLSGDNQGIGYQNIEMARQKLHNLNIPIDGDDTGGTIGRIAEFDITTGLVEIITKM